MHTLVGRLHREFELHPDPREVQSVLHVPLVDLFDDSRWEDRPWQIGDRTYGSSPHFHHGEHLIWGLTGRLIRDLVAAATSSR